MAGMVSVLPALRTELSLHPGPTAADGSPSWTIRDPVRNRYFRISWPAFEILCRWWAGSPAKIAETVSAETTLHPTEDDVKGVAEFLVANQLTQPADPQDTQRLVTRAEAEKQSWFHWLMHHYLFFRIPLVRPDHWLGRTLPLVRWLGSRWFRVTTITALTIGLILTGRQWDRFVTTLVDTFSLSGLVSYGIALTVVKVIHELAHAYTAKNHGCRVPSMGVAFLVLWPMLYTDVNDTWMLPERKKRLQVGSAGIIAELSVAAWATLAWAFLPEGPWKQAAFVLAALTWISSMAINLSPFMRFDGYFIAMDALEMPNLHPRSFAMARWWLREVLFGLGAPPPELLPSGKRRALIAFAVAVWIYRLVLFLGIAAMVYHFFIKVVGIVLFVVEIWWFVARPIWAEVREWEKSKTSIMAGTRIRWTLGALGVLFLLALIPWQGSVTAPAVMKGARSAALHLPFPARMEAIHVSHGQEVKPGDVLMSFTAPDIDLRKAVILARIDGKTAELEAATLDPLLRDRAGIVQEDLRKAKAELAALVAEANRLSILAPMEGRVLDILPGIKPGDWFSPRQKLGLILGNSAPIAVAYLAEDELARIQKGADVTFSPHALESASRRGRVQRIDPSPAKTLPDGALASVHGGDIPARVSGQNIIPDGAVTRVTITLEGPPPAHEEIGTISIQAESSSFIGRLAKSVMVVLIREWGA
ncbi:MAG: HlyD family efflux transporter periplasmic adaptor subunit [Alphaproteobacteria bacterium]|nr:HlyD family efflux transporter periplasmic adaptor subunit [Alphaproteobacteria bacterium]